MKRKIFIPVLFIVTLICAFCLYACGSSDDESGGGKVGVYTLGGIIVNANTVNEYFVDPDDMSSNEQNAYKQKISEYGEKITVKEKGIDFDGLILAQYNSAKYSMSGKNIVFFFFFFKAEFTYVTLENGVLSLCYTKDLTTPIVFEYYSSKYVAPSYKITFDYGENGDDSWITEKEVQFNMAVGELPSHEIAGYTFNGWRLGYSPVTDGTRYKWKKDIVLVANWSANTYKVTYEYDGATGGYYYSESDVIFNSTLYRLPTPTKTGYIFGGWFTEQDGGGQEITFSTKWTFAENTILYAKWISNEFTLVFDYQGAQGVTERQNVYYGIEVGALPQPIKAGGNTFGGWFTEVGGEGEEYTAETVYSQTKNLTLYAKWNTNVTFDYDGATSDNDVISLAVVYNGAITTMPRPHKIDYSFDGWFNGNTEYRIGEAFTAAGTTALKAKWIEGTDKENFAYTQSSSGVNITGLSEKGKNLTSIIIPIQIDSQEKLSIASNAFKDTHISIVTVPESVTEIGSGAFLGCPLTEITIPFVGYSANTLSSRTRVLGAIFGMYTGDSATGDKYVYQPTGGYYNYSPIPKTLKKVTVTRADGLGVNSFYNCTMLTEININPAITTIPSYAFYNCTNLETLSSLANVNSVGDSTFENCKKLNAVNDIQPLKTVGDSAFAKTPLNAVMFTDMITSIGEQAFKDTHISIVTVPESVTEIGSGAFLGCPLTEITIPFVGYSANTLSSRTRVLGAIFGMYTGDSATGDKYVYQPTGGYYNYSPIPKTLKKVTVTRADGLGVNSFYNCTMLTEININPETKVIPDKAFYNCGITKFTIPDGITDITRGAFQGCSYLDTFGVPLKGTYDANSFSYLNYLFGGTEYNGTNYVPSQLKTVIVTGTAKSISPYAFYNCANLNFITVNHDITAIGQQAFKGCSSLKAITMNCSAPALGADALTGTLEDMIFRVAEEHKNSYQTTWNIDESRIYERNKSYVQFDSRGGSAVDYLFVNNGSKIAEPATPRRSNYIFLGWYSDLTLKTKFDFNAPIESDTMLYAKWKYESIALDTEVTVDMNTYAGETYYFTFKPETSGYFTIRSYGDLDTTGILFNASGSQITSNSNGGTGISPNFLIRYRLTAGTTYIIGVRLTSTTATGEFSIMISNG